MPSRPTAMLTACSRSDLGCCCHAGPVPHCRKPSPRQPTACTSGNQPQQQTKTQMTSLRPGTTAGAAAGGISSCRQQRAPTSAAAACLGSSTSPPQVVVPGCCAPTSCNPLLTSPHCRCAWTAYRSARLPCSANGCYCCFCCSLLAGPANVRPLDSRQTPVCLDGACILYLQHKHYMA